MRSIVTLLLVAAFGISVGCGGDTPAAKDTKKTDPPKTETPAEPAK